MKYKALSILLAFLCSLSSSLQADEIEKRNTKLIIQDAWIAEAPPVSKVMVAYMTLNNPGDAAIEVSQAKSGSFSSIEFHETVHEDGMARMVRHSSLIIPADGRLELKRGGPHLMLFNPVKEFKAGDTIKINLMTTDNKSKTITVTVKKPQF